jgi:hypothetical protein
LNTLPDTGSPHALSSNLPHHGYRRPVVADWCELVEGDYIVLLRAENNDDSISGTVDAIAADGSLIWLLQKGPAGRRMFHRVDGYKTLLETPASEHTYPEASDFASAAWSGALALGGQLLSRYKSSRD